MTFKNRFIQFMPAEDFFIIFDSQTNKKILGYTDTCRQALEFIEELEKQGELDLKELMDRNLT